MGNKVPFRNYLSVQGRLVGLLRGAFSLGDSFLTGDKLHDILVTTADALTAHAGGGQQVASYLTSVANRFATVATIADSATLPPTTGEGADLVGLKIEVYNTAANSMNVFPNNGEAINGLGANAAFAVAGGKSAIFRCTAAGQWASNLSA